MTPTTWVVWVSFRVADNFRKIPNYCRQSTGFGGNNRDEDSQLILRIHRGRPCGTPQRTPLSVHSMSSTLSVNSNGAAGAGAGAGGGGGGGNANEDHQMASALLGTPKRATSMRVNRQRHEKVAIKVSFPSSENMLESPRLGGSQAPPPSPHYAVISSTKGGGGASALSNGRRASFKSSLFDIGETTFNLDTANRGIWSGAGQLGRLDGG